MAKKNEFGSDSASFQGGSKFDGDGAASAARSQPWSAGEQDLVSQEKVTLVQRVESRGFVVDVEDREMPGREVQAVTAITVTSPKGTKLRLEGGPSGAIVVSIPTEDRRRPQIVLGGCQVDHEKGGTKAIIDQEALMGTLTGEVFVS